nr:MAG TPA: hypothetical protein [Bacteriophage sp.]
MVLYFRLPFSSLIVWPLSSFKYSKNLSSPQSMLIRLGSTAVSVVAFPLR